MAAEKNAPPRTLYRKFKQPFFLTEIYSAEPPSVSIVKELSEKSENRGFAPASSGGAVAGSARLARLRAARSNSERAARRIALATGLALRLFGTDRIAAPGHAAGRGWVGPDG